MKGNILFFMENDEYVKQDKIIKTRGVERRRIKNIRRGRGEKIELFIMHGKSHGDIKKNLCFKRIGG